MTETATPTGTPTPTLNLTRWTVTSGSNSQSRGAVVITAGDHHWRASAEGNGAIDSLYRAVDKALAEILDGHPRLVAFEIHSLGEGTEAEGAVSVRIAPPAVGGERGSGEYPGTSSGTNVIAASIEAYVVALNAMLAEEHWRGAPEAAAASGTAGTPVPAGEARTRRAELDEAAGEIDTTDWFNRQG
jgi:LeuA allosteric (dimerisation) domain